MSKTRRPRTHKEYTPLLPCEGKNQYKTEAEAVDAAEFHMLEDMTVELAVYQCHVCSYWHMTSQAATDWRKEMPKR